MALNANHKRFFSDKGVFSIVTSAPVTSYDIKIIGVVHKSSRVTMKNSFFQLGSSGFVDLFKTTSNLYVAGGLIFKGLIIYFSMIIYYSAIILWRKPLKIRPLLN